MAKYKIIPSSRTIVQSPISIGHKAEKGVEAIEFDLTAWVETYGSGTLTVIMRRWGDAIPYPIALEIDENNKATWTLSDTDTAKAGMAYAQLSYIVGDTVVKKSDIYTFRVMDSLTGEGDPPEAYESWLEHLTHFAAEAMAEVLDIESIVTDKTLTVDGGIADAKATGEALAEKVDAADYSTLSARVGANTIALAEKADRSTTYTKAQVDQMIEDVEVETDTTLEIAGAAADAKATGDALSALEDQFTKETDKLKADLGDLSDLETESKTDLVSAINEAAQSGLSDEMKEALLECISHVYWDDNLGETHYANLENALNGAPTEIWSWSTEYSGAGRLKKGGSVYDKSVNGERRGFIYSITDNLFGIHTDKGKQCVNGSDNNPVPDVFPIPIPSTATKVTITVTPATDYLFGYIGKYVRGSGGGTGYDYIIMNEAPTWTHKGTYECTFEAQKNLFLGYNGKKADNSNYTSAERNNRVVTVTFE